MTREELIFILKTLASAPSAVGLENTLDRLRARDIADVLEGFDILDVTAIMEKLPDRTRAKVFAEIPEETKKDLLSRLSRTTIEDLFRELPGDEQADLFNQLGSETQTDMLPVLSLSEQEGVMTLASFPEGTAGSLASADFVQLAADQSVAEALEHIRAVAHDTETIYVGYVLDANRRITGTVSLRDLVVADPTTSVGSLRTEDPIVVAGHAAVTEAVETIRRYDLIALPVVDESSAILGIISVDDALDTERWLSQRQLTSFGASGLAGQDHDIKHSRFRRIIGVRGLWLGVLTFFGILTSTFVAAQEELLEAAIILAAFIAPIVDMGGNTGSQSATLVIRALALGDYKVTWRDVWRVIRREIPVVLTLAVGIAVLEVVLAYFSKGVGGTVLLVVGLAMAANIIIGGLLGSLMPFAARKLKTDPAALSAPMITSIMDFVGVLVYFGLAYLFLAELIT